MIFLIGGIIAAIMCLLPIWVLPIASAIVGYAFLYSWKQALRFSLVATVIVMVVATGLDFQDHGLISKRMGGAMSLPWFLVPVLPGVLTLWIGVFFARLGSSFRIICRKSSN